MQDNIHKDNSFFTDWWDQINKPILISILSLIFIGLFISLTINQNDQYSNTSNIFSVFSSQAIYLIIGLALCFIISFAVNLPLLSAPSIDGSWLQSPQK